MQTLGRFRCADSMASLLVLIAAVSPVRAQRECTQFEDQKLEGIAAGPHDDFGEAVAISSDRVIVGAPTGAANTGEVHIYRLDNASAPDGSVWIPETKLHASDPAWNDAFGSAVAIDGDRVVVGARGKDGTTTEFSGAVYVFRRTINSVPADPADTSWVQEAKLVAPDPADRDHFGDTVAISGNHIAVGAPTKDEVGVYTGAVYVFRLNDGQTPLDPTDDTWELMVKLVPPDAEPGDLEEFGFPIVMDERRIFAGARGDDNSSGQGAGSVYLFQLDDNNTPVDPSDDVWVLDTKLLPLPAHDNYRFPRSLALDGNTLAAGDYSLDGGPLVRVYAFTGSNTPLDPTDDAWIEIAAMDRPTNGIWSNRFGKAVALKGNWLVVGDSGADAGCLPNEYCGAGATCVFERQDPGTPVDPTDDVWIRRNTLHASDGGKFDDFGAAVAIRSGRVVTGSPAFLRDGSAQVFSLGLPATECVQDGVFCNGEEYCVDGLCIAPNADPCAPGEVCCELVDHCGTPETCFTVGFEPEEGFVPGLIHGQPGGMSTEKIWGFGPNGSPTEGEIITEMPLTGTQHLRLDAADVDPPELFQVLVNARLPADAHVTPGIVAPTVISLGMRHVMSDVIDITLEAPTQGRRVASVVFDSDGETTVVLEEYKPHPVNLNYYSGYEPEYQRLTIGLDPCDRFMCFGGENHGELCDTNAECTGGRCLGRINYLLTGGLSGFVHYGGMNGGSAIEQLIISRSTYFQGPLDFDDVTWEVGEPCPVVCGNGDIEVGEDCEPGDDSACPRACVPPGQTGPDGEANCTCVLPYAKACDAQPVTDDSVIEMTGHGGWFRFTARAPAYAVETCGSDYQSHLSVWTGSCADPELLVFNRACVQHHFHIGAPHSDPLSHCYTERGNAYYNYATIAPACTCLPTVIGQEYFIYDDRAKGSPTHTINLRLTPRFECTQLGTTGACCDRVNFTCTENVPGWECVGGDGDYIAYFHNGTCSACTPVTGACCDRSVGTCTSGVPPSDCNGVEAVYTPDEDCWEVSCTRFDGACCDQWAGRCDSHVRPEDCVGNDLVFTAEVECLEVNCTGFRGACCDRLTGICTDDVGASLCVGANRVFAQDQTCAATTCTQVLGACCDTTPIDGHCTDDVSSAHCQGPNLQWLGGQTCSEIACVPDVIPAVSEWGLVALALVLLAAAKIAFRHHEAHARHA